MKLSLTTSGLLDPKRLDSWVPEKRRAIRKAVEAGMKVAGKEIAQAAQSRMQSAFKVMGNDVLIAGQGFIGLYARSEGVKTLRLPGRYTVYDEEGRPLCGPVSAFEATFRRHECRSGRSPRW